MLKIAWSPFYNHPLPEHHRFPMIKYDLIREQLLYEGTIAEQNLFEPTPLDQKWITLTHDAEYIENLRVLRLSRSEIRKIGFPLSKELVDREILIMNGTLQCCLFALQYGVSMNIAGGTHHAFRDRGEGFCLLNDLAIAANYLLDTGIRNRILILDLDVHQGNGTASFFQHEVRVFTFSMHGAKNYPLRKEISDLDIDLEDGITDRKYLEILQRNLDDVLERFEPDFILFQSGVDVLEGDKLGRLKVSMEGCKNRDHMVLRKSKDHDIPIAICMGGGYSQRLRNVIEAHANTFRQAQELFF